MASHSVVAWLQLMVASRLAGIVAKWWSRMLPSAAIAKALPSAAEAWPPPVALRKLSSPSSARRAGINGPELLQLPRKSRPHFPPCGNRKR